MRQGAAAHGRARDGRRWRAPRQYTDCGAVIAQAIIPPMKSTSRPMPWWKTVILAIIAVLLSAVVTGSVAFILDHLLWE
jgi:hypothetical protein